MKNKLIFLAYGLVFGVVSLSQADQGTIQADAGNSRVDSTVEVIVDDQDRDGISDANETATSLYKADTDFDGLLDGEDPDPLVPFSEQITFLPQPSLIDYIYNTNGYRDDQISSLNRFASLAPTTRKFYFKSSGGSNNAIWSYRNVAHNPFALTNPNYPGYLDYSLSHSSSTVTFSWEIVTHIDPTVTTRRRYFQKITFDLPNTINLNDGKVHDIAITFPQALYWGRIDAETQEYDYTGFPYNSSPSKFINGSTSLNPQFAASSMYDTSRYHIVLDGVNYTPRAQFFSEVRNTADFSTQAAVFVGSEHDTFYVYPGVKFTASQNALNDYYRHDTDMDGVGDLTEILEKFTNPYYHDRDIDGDGLTNDQEIAGVFGNDNFSPTNPEVADSDGDGFDDYWEVKYDFDPTDANVPVRDDPNTTIIEGDSDGDGLGVYAEYIHGTHPHLQDSDGNGITDGVQFAAPAEDPNNVALNPADYDGNVTDGVNPGDLSHNATSTVSAFDGIINWADIGSIGIRGATYSGYDTNGPRFRKVSIFGRPIREQAPQSRGESSLAEEETFVDAYSLSLHHDTSHIFTPLEASDLVLQASASMNGMIYQDRSGLRPSERLDLPLGMGWTSSLCSYLEVSETIGGLFADVPMQIKLIDENGRPLSFETHDLASFVQLPSSTENSEGLQSTITRSGSDFILRKKHGVTLTYTPCSAWIQHRDDRIETTYDVPDEFAGFQKYTYWRLTKLVDRYGVVIEYDYQSQYSLIPVEISSPSRPGQFISINRTADGKRIRSITDSRGNTTSFSYDSLSLAHSTSVLTSVTHPDGSKTRYTYSPDTQTDPDAYTQNPADKRPVDHFHINLASIQDGRGNKTNFSYVRDLSRKHDNSNLPYGVQEQIYGMPRRVNSISHPNGRSVSFSKTGNVVFDRQITLPTQFVTTVNDASGVQTTYNFRDLSAYIASTTRTNNNSWAVRYGRMEIHHSNLGMEEFFFENAAGDELCKYIDLSGNERTWDYGDNLSEGQFNLSAYYSSWADVTQYTDALGRVSSYGYDGNFRLWIEENDAYGSTTNFIQDDLGRRVSAIYRDASGDILKTDRNYYKNSFLKGFVTQSVVSADHGSVSGQAWERDIITEHVPDSLGRVWKSITDPNGLGLTTTKTYDYNNNLLSQIDPRGNTMNFHYDSRNRLVKTDYPSAGTANGDAITSKELWYDESGNIAAEIDEEGNYIIYHYDNLNRLIATIQDMDKQGLPSKTGEVVLDGDEGSITAEDLVTTAEYNSVGSVIRLTDPRGYVTRTFYDNLQRPIHVFTGFTETEAASNSISTCSSVAAGSTEKTHTEFQYTDTGLVTSTGTYDGNPGTAAIRGEGFKPTVTINHDAVQTATGVIDVTTYNTYDALYRPLLTEVEYQSGVFAVTQQAYGSIAGGKETLEHTITDSRNKVVKTLKDGLMRVTNTWDAFGTPLESETQTDYSSTGLVWRMTDPLNRVTETEYDRAGRPTKIWSPDPITGQVNKNSPNDPLLGSPVIETIYDANGNVVATINPLGERWDYEFDARNRQIRELQPSVANAENPAAPVMARPEMVTSYNGVGQILEVQDARGFISKTEYDSAYRPIKVWQGVGTPDETLTQNEYDTIGNIITLTDPNGNKTQNTYDALNRLLTIATNPVSGDPSVDPSTPNTDDITRINQYDDSGNLVHVTDGKDQMTAFTYDGLGRKTRAIWDPGSSEEQIEISTYDAIVKTQRIDAKGQITNYTYDDLHREEIVTYVDRPQDNQTMVYDLVGNILSVTYPNESTQNQTIRACAQTYDHLNRVITETSNGVTHSTTYDKAGNIRTKTYGQTNRVLTCSYDALNRMTTSSEQAGAEIPKVTSYAYAQNGNITRKTLPNATYTDKAYDALNRITTITNVRSNGNIIHQLTNTYDHVGNVTECLETSASTASAGGTMTTVNDYDKTYRLKKETRTDTGQSPAEIKVTDYTYDKANNRSSKIVTTNNGTPQISTYSYGGAGYNSNQLVSYNRPDTGEIVTFTYDANGNRATRSVGANTDIYTYDVDNRLVSLNHQTNADSNKNGSYNYLYDHRTRRVNRNESAANGDDTLLVFSDGLSVQEHTSVVSANPEVEYIRGSDYGGGVGGVLYTIRNGAASFNYYNSRGDVLAKTDNTGSTTWQANYEAFGTRTAENGTNEDRQKANTKDEDPTGLLNEGMRYRDLEAGVFITRDPAGFVDGPNVYTYVNQNPWTFYDPLGLSKWQTSMGAWMVNTFGPPPAPVKFMAKHKNTVVGAVHTVNGVASMVPVVGKVADGLDAAIYAADGDLKSAGLTLATGKLGRKAVEGVQAVVKGGDKAVDAANVIKNVTKQADNAANVIKNVTKQADNAANATKNVAKQADNAATTGNKSAKVTVHATDDHVAPKTGLGNPFKNKTAAEIDEMFTKKGFTKSGPDPAGGTGGYVNPKTGRSYHIDPKGWGKYPEPNHVDVNRLRDYKGSLDKKKLPYKED